MSAGDIPRRPGSSAANAHVSNGEVDGLAIVDAVVAPDEMPNLPHIKLETMGNYAMAKIKEAVLAVTGR